MRQAKQIAAAFRAFEMDTPSQKENDSEKASYTHTSQITLVQPKSSDGRHWSVFEKVLLALVLLFFVGFLIFVVLYATTEAATTTKEAKGKLVLLLQRNSTFHTIVTIKYILRCIWRAE